MKRRWTAFAGSDEAIAERLHLIVVGPRREQDHAPIPSLLATGAVHHHLVREAEADRVRAVVETGEAREVMHFCLLTGYGAGAVNPYLAFETLDELVARRGVGRERPAKRNRISSRPSKRACSRRCRRSAFRRSTATGRADFRGVGLSTALVERCFTGTASRIGGIGAEDVGARR
jgi:glutamate synthase (NADPH) large chain